MHYGTDPELLHRADSDETSIDAAYVIDSTKLERMVHEAIIDCGADGAIADDLLERFARLPYSSVTARFAALERKGFIVRLGDKRPGKSGRNQQVMRDRAFAEDDE